MQQSEGGKLFVEEVFSEGDVRLEVGPEAEDELLVPVDHVRREVDLLLRPVLAERASELRLLVALEAEVTAQVVVVLIELPALVALVLA